MYKFPDYPKFSIVSLDGFCTHWEKKKKLTSHSGFQTWHWFHLLIAIVGLLFSHQTVVHSIELQATDGNDRPLTDCSIVNSGKIDVKTPFVVEVADWWCNWQNTRNTLYRGVGRGVRVCLLILQSYCFALYFYFLLFSTLYHRKVIKINHSEFTWQKLQ